MLRNSKNSIETTGHKVTLKNQLEMAEVVNRKEHFAEK